jgi:inner membrane protein
VASLFTHVFTAVAVSAMAAPRVGFRKSMVLGAVCSVLPDADVWGHYAGVSSRSFWGHRGFTHSFFFALVWALLLAWMVRRDPLTPGEKSWRGVYFFLCTVSHGILDGFTTGNRGVAFFAPFDNSRYVLPGNIIPISPLGVQNFFTERGWEVIKAEFLIVWLPLGALALLCWHGRLRIRRAAARATSAERSQSSDRSP